jgi:hypothetical protein
MYTIPGNFPHSEDEDDFFSSMNHNTKKSFTHEPDLYQALIERKNQLNLVPSLGDGFCGLYCLIYCLSCYTPSIDLIALIKLLKKYNTDGNMMESTVIASIFKEITNKDLPILSIGLSDSKERTYLPLSFDLMSIYSLDFFILNKSGVHYEILTNKQFDGILKFSSLNKYLEPDCLDLEKFKNLYEKTTLLLDVTDNKGKGEGKKYNSDIEDDDNNSFKSFEDSNNQSDNVNEMVEEVSVNESEDAFDPEELDPDYCDFWSENDEQIHEQIMMITNEHDFLAFKVLHPVEDDVQHNAQELINKALENIHNREIWQDCYDQMNEKTRKVYFDALDKIQIRRLQRGEFNNSKVTLLLEWTEPGPFTVDYCLSFIDQETLDKLNQTSTECDIIEDRPAEDFILQDDEDIYDELDEEFIPYYKILNRMPRSLTDDIIFDSIEKFENDLKLGVYKEYELEETMENEDFNDNAFEEEDVTNWADIMDMEDQKVNITENNWLEEMKNEITDVQETKAIEHNCYTAVVNENIEIEKLPNLLHLCEDQNVSVFNYTCFHNMYIELVTAIDKISENFFSNNADMCYKNYFIESIKCAFKYRHNIWNTIPSLILSKYQIPTFGTDVAFNEMFDFMESKRTPDNIIIRDKNVLIIETSVASNFRKTSLQKGFDMGSSKYRIEIDELIKNGFNVQYFINFLDMSTGDHDLDNFKKLIKDFLNYTYDESIFENLIDDTLKLLRTHRSIEQYGYLVFGRSEINWNKNIIDKFNEINNAFIKRLDAVEEKKKPTRMLKINKHAYESVISNQESLVTRLYMPTFDEKFVSLLFRNGTIDVVKDSRNGMEPNKMMESILNGDWSAISKNLFIMNPTHKGWINCLERGPYHTISFEKKLRQKELTCNSHVHKTLAPNFIIDNIQAIKTRNNYEIEYLTINDFYKGYEHAKKNNELLINKLVTKESVSQAMKKYIEDFDDTINKIKVHNPKNIFTMPFIDAQNVTLTKMKTSDFHFTETATYLHIISRFENSNGIITRRALSKDSINSMKKLNSDYRMYHNKIVFDHFKMDKRLKYKDLEKMASKSDDKKLKDTLTKIKDVKDQISSILKNSENYSKTGCVLKLNRSEEQAIKKEYMWDDKRFASIDRSFKYIDDQEMDSIMNLMINTMFGEQKNISIDMEKYTHPGKDSESMIKMKNLMNDSIKESLNEIKHKNILSMSLFINKFIYTLTYFSKNNMKSNEFAYSNLGYDDTVLIVRGGKSVNRTGDSRQFRLQYPCPEYFFKYREYLFSDSTKITKNNKGTFLLTPWMNVHERVLCDMVNCFEKVLMNLAIYQNRVSKECGKNLHYDNISINFLLMFNNRRSTEKMLADLRYPLVNCTGIYSDLEGIISGIVKKPDDFVQFMIGKRFKYYENFALQFISDTSSIYGKLHPFSKSKILGPTDYTYLIYSTYMMTKAPFKQHIEQSKNLEGMMKIHEEFDLLNVENNIYSMLDKTETNDPSKIFSNDFYYSPKYSFMIGKRLSQIMNEKSEINNLNNDFYKCFTESWYSIENESGLRDDNLKSEVNTGFFGKKSHEVVTKLLMQRMQNMDPKKALDNLRENIIDDFKKAKEFSSYDISFVEMINDISEFTKFKFHVVDKIQWKGNREIYVMTISTKIHQNPLESFFKKICQKIDNEIISIPSDRRSTLIHSQLHENKYVRDKKMKFHKYNLSLDCRKWGPKSNFNKYYYMFLGCCEILPPEFMEYFAYFTHGYFDKEIIVSPKAQNVFSNNERLKKYIKYFETVEELKTFKFKMPYSFVMGIFNYLSSLYHAVAQDLNSNMIQQHILNKYKTLIIFKMNAHSDDSGGYILIPETKESTKNNILEEILGLYETMMKYGNMMLSTKKCVVSSSYFELLSILYLNDKLLPMVPKFFGNMSIKPTNNGYSSDITQGYSKCIELLQNGATFSEAYLAMRIFSETYRNLYHFTHVDDEKPISAFGGLYSHPLVVMLLGAKSDNLRLYRYDKKRFIKYLSVVDELNGNNKVKYNQNGFSIPIFKENKRSLIEMRERCKGMYDYYILPDKGEFVSLTDQNDYFSISYNLKDSKYNYKILDVDEDYLTLQNVSNNEEVMLKIPDLISVTRNDVCKNQLTRLLGFVNNQIKDPEFVNSLNYVSNTRRLTELYYRASNVYMNTTIGSLPQKFIPQLVEAIVDSNITGEEIDIKIDHKKIDEKSIMLEKLYDGLLGDSEFIYEYINDTILEETYMTKNISSTKITTKPCHIQLLLNTKSLIIRANPIQIFYSSTDAAFMVNKYMDYTKDKDYLSGRMTDFGLNPSNYSDFSLFTRNMNKTYEKEFYCYSYVLPEYREVQDYKGLASLIETNSSYMMRMNKVFKNVQKAIRSKYMERIDPEMQKIFKILKISHYLYRNYHHNALLYEGIKVNDYIRLKTTDFFSTFLIKNPKQLRNLDWHYGWNKPQVKIGNTWTGSGNILFITPSALLEVTLIKNVLSSIKCNINPEELTNSQEINLLFYLLEKLNVKVYNYISTKSHNFCIDGSGSISIKREKSTNFHWSLIHEDRSLDYYLDQRVRSYNNFQGICNGIKYNSIICETDLDLNLKGVSNFPREMKNLNNPDIEKDAANYKELLSNFPETDLYKTAIHRKLDDNTYKLIECLKEGCKKLNIEYNDLLITNIETIIGMNIDLNILPDEVYFAIRDSESFFKIKDQYESFLNDIFGELIKGNEANFPAIITKWGRSAQNEFNSLKLYTENKFALDDPYMLINKNIGMAQIALHKLEYSIIECISGNLEFSLKNPEICKYPQYYNFNESDMRKIFYFIRRENSINKFFVNHHVVSKPAHFLYEIYSCIFTDKGLYKKWAQCVNEDTLLKSLLKTPENYRKWAILHYTMYNVLGKIDQNYLKISDYNEYEFKIRRNDETEKSYAGQNASFSKSRLFFMDLPNTVQLTNQKQMKHQYIKFDRGEIEHDLFVTPGNVDKYEFLNSKKAKEICDISKILYFTDPNSLNEYLKENVEKKNMNKIKKKNIDFIPVIEVLGTLAISNIAAKYNSCIMVCTCLPPDVNKFMGELEICDGPVKIGDKIVNGMAYYIGYKLNFKLNKMFGISPHGEQVISINDMYYDNNDKTFYNLSQNITIRLQETTPGITQKQTHDHDCKSEMSNYKNPNFKDCFFNYIKSQNKMDEKSEVQTFIDAEELANVKKDIKKMEENNIGAMFQHHYLKKVINKLENKDFESMILSALNDLNSLKKDEIKIDFEERAKSEMINTNSYSPIDRNSYLYQELKLLFEDDTDYILNRSLQMSKDSQTKCLLDIKSKKLIYTKMYDKMMLNMREMKSMRLLLRWFELLVKNSQIVDEGEGDLIILNSLNKINNELISKIDDINKLDDDDMIEYYD